MMDEIAAPTSVRLAHVSDLHVTLPFYPWERGDWLNKRVTGWINVRWLGRGKRFREAEQVLTVLVQELRQRRPDHVAFSGDASMLGLDEEFSRVHDLLGLSNGERLPGTAVPGNHDYYVRSCARGGFENYFAPWQQGLRINDQPYPFAQKVGHVWILGVRSAIVNRWPWDATGLVDEQQLERLRELGKHLDEGPRIVVTHYPLCMANGKLEGPTHRLRNVQETASVAEEIGVGLWLHGHRHQAYQLQQTPFSSFPTICAGSATQAGRWSYGEYQISGRQLQASRRAYDPEKQCFCEIERFELEIT